MEALNNLGPTPRQKRFADEYLIDMNATKAYFRAGYKASNESVAAACASRLLRNAKVSSYIRQRQEILSKRTYIDQERIIREYARIAFYDIRKAFDESGCYKEIKDLDDDLAASISRFKVRQTYAGSGARRKSIGKIVSMNFMDRRAALYDLGRHLGMFGKEVTMKLSIKEIEEMSVEELERLLRQLEGNQTN